MKIANQTSDLNGTPNQLFLAKSLVYDKCNLKFDKLIIEEESQEYGACTFTLNKYRIEFRISKITPAKAGQFVTIWKRNSQNVTRPFDLTDKIDFIIISSKDGHRFGQFVFPLNILNEKGIISGKLSLGKRGIRVYPPWNNVTSKQAEKTQNWQTKYFLTIQNDYSTNLTFAKKLFFI